MLSKPLLKYCENKTEFQFVFLCFLRVYILYIDENVCIFQSLAPYLPRDDPRLNPAIYEMVLNEFLQTDCKVKVSLSSAQLISSVKSHVVDHDFKVALSFPIK